MNPALLLFLGSIDCAACPSLQHHPCMHSHRSQKLGDQGRTRRQVVDGASLAVKRQGTRNEFTAATAEEEECPAAVLPWHWHQGARLLIAS